MPTTLPDDAPLQRSEPAAPPLRFEASIGPALSIPMARNPDRAGFGFGLTYGVGWGDIPLSLGLDFMSLGSIGDASSQLSLELADGPVSAQRKLHTRLLHFEAYVRVQPAHWFLRPYLEAFAGAQLLQGRLTVNAAAELSDAAHAQQWVRSLGWGLGMELLRVFSHDDEALSLTFGVRRVYGGRVNVLTPVVIANEQVQTRYEADTSVWLIMLGIGLHYELSESRGDGR